MRIIIAMILASVCLLPAQETGVPYYVAWTGGQDTGGKVHPEDKMKVADWQGGNAALWCPFPVVRSWAIDYGPNASPGVSISSTNRPVWTNAVGGAMVFDGNDYFSFTNSIIQTCANFGTNDSFSILAWVSFNTNTVSTSPIVAKRVSSNQEGYELSVFRSGTNALCVFKIEQEDNTTAEIQTSVGWANPKGWHHVAAVRDVVEDKLFLYVDGTQATTPITDTTTATLSNSVSLTIGANLGLTVPTYFLGMISEVILSRRAYSSNDVHSAYQLGSTNFFGKH